VQQILIKKNLLAFKNKNVFDETLPVRGFLHLKNLLWIFDDLQDFSNLEGFKVFIRYTLISHPTRRSNHHVFAHRRI